MSSTVAIFRKRLLSYSETFIADQGQKLPTWEPLYCGFAADTSGIGLIESSPRLLLSDLSAVPALAKFLLRRGQGAGRWLTEIQRRDPRVIHAHFFNDGLDAVEIGKRLDLPVVTTLHGHDITKHDNANRGNPRTAGFFASVTRVIAVSRFIAEQALARGCPEDKLLQHYIGIDLERFSNAKRETEHPSLLFVGRLVEKKGCTYLLQAVQKLKPRFPELQLTLVGDGGLAESLRREAEEREIDVVFCGSQDAGQIREHMSRSWLFVAPSITAADGDAEGLGMVFLEAQALETPVVSFRSGGVVEAVQDETSGLLCDEKDVDALAANIATLLENRDLRHNMGLAGRRRVEEQFDIRRQCAKLETIYAELC